MPTTPRFPKYRRYKPKNLAVVRLDGQDIYLGKYDSPESWEKYHRLAADRIQNGRPVPIAELQKPTSQLTIIGMLHLYLREQQRPVTNLPHTGVVVTVDGWLGPQPEPTAKR